VEAAGLEKVTQTKCLEKSTFLLGEGERDTRQKGRIKGTGVNRLSNRGDDSSAPKNKRYWRGGGSVFDC